MTLLYLTEVAQDYRERKDIMELNSNMHKLEECVCILRRYANEICGKICIFCKKDRKFHLYDEGPTVPCIARARRGTTCVQ